MPETMNPSRVLQSISVLYELALAAGKSVDPLENCDAFLTALMGRKNLDFAGVWVRADLLPESTESEVLVPFYSAPSFRGATDPVCAKDPVVTLLREHPALSLDASHLAGSSLRIPCSMQAWPLMPGSRRSRKPTARSPPCWISSRVGAPRYRPRFGGGTGGMREHPRTQGSRPRCRRPRPRNGIRPTSRRTSG